MGMQFNLGAVRINDVEVRNAIANPRTDVYYYTRMVMMQGFAVTIFNSRARHDNLTTFPAYTSSFKIRRVRKLWGHAFDLVNDDPASFWVEFGAYIRHPTHARILAYRPLGLAMDAVAALEGGI